MSVSIFRNINYVIWFYMPFYVLQQHEHQVYRDWSGRINEVPAPVFYIFFPCSFKIAK